MTFVPDLAVDTLAVHRLTRLVTRDAITRPFRARWIAAAYGTSIHRSSMAHTESEWDQLPHDDDDAPKLAAFIVCPFCTGLWISFGVIAARRYASVLWDPLARALALSSAAGLIAAHADE